MTDRPSRELQTLRRGIDALDRRIAPLLARRFALAVRTAAFKRALRDAARERAVLRGVLSSSRARGASARALAAVYRELFRRSLLLQRSARRERC
ncbi:MAG: chorismate mutase [Elusimicrobiota bacterium]|jgi:chorismate mutase